MDMSSELCPLVKKSSIGFFKKKTVNPVQAKTIKIITTCQALSRFHRSFNFSTQSGVGMLLRIYPCNFKKLFQKPFDGGLTSRTIFSFLTG